MALIASSDRASTASFGNMLQCLRTLIVKNFFLLSNLNLLSFSLKPLPLVLSPHDPVSWFGPGQQLRTTQSLYRDSPRWSGEESGKKKTKLMGRDKGSLTEQQTMQTGSIILIRIIYKTNSKNAWSNSHCLMTSKLLSRDSSPSGPLPSQNRG